MSDIKKLQAEVKKFCNERDWEQFHTPKDLAIGVATEASEILELFRFQSEKDTAKALRKPGFRKDLGEELSDTLYFILRLGDVCGIDLKKAFRAKMQKNAKKYPVRVARGSNKKR